MHRMSHREFPHDEFGYSEQLKLRLRSVYTYRHRTVFVSGNYGLFNITCKHPHRTALNPFLNATKNGDIDGICKISFRCTINITIFYYHPQTKFAKVMFLHLSVSHSVHSGGGGGGIPACIAGDIPACLAGLQGGVASQHTLQVSRGLQAHTQGEVEGSGLGGLQAHTLRESPLQAHTQREVSRPTPTGVSRPDTLLSRCILVPFKIGFDADLWCCLHITSNDQRCRSENGDVNGMCNQNLAGKYRKLLTFNRMPRNEERSLRSWKNVRTPSIQISRALVNLNTKGLRLLVTHVVTLLVLKPVWGNFYQARRKR